MGVKRENVILVDTVGVVYTGRTEKMNPYKQRFAADTDRRTLADAMKGADVFVGVSAARRRHAGDAAVDGARTRSCSRWRTPTPRSVRASRSRHGPT